MRVAVFGECERIITYIPTRSNNRHDLVVDYPHRSIMTVDETWKWRPPSSVTQRVYNYTRIIEGDSSDRELLSNPLFCSKKYMYDLDDCPNKATLPQTSSSRTTHMPATRTRRYTPFTQCGWWFPYTSDGPVAVSGVTGEAADTSMAEKTSLNLDAPGFQSKRDLVVNFVRNE